MVFAELAKRDSEDFAEEIDVTDEPT